MMASTVYETEISGGVPPFNVTCDMTDKNGVGVTAISHESEDRTLVDGKEAPGKYSRDIQYTEVDFKQLANLTSFSRPQTANSLSSMSALAH